MSTATTSFDVVGRPDQAQASKLCLFLLWFQGLYYLVTGLWPIISIETFQMVTGRKTDNAPTGREGDHWLVMTVAVLIVAVSLSLLCAAWRRRGALETAVLAISSAIGLTAIDIIYVSRDVIPPIYLADAALEVPLIVAWMVEVLGRPRQAS